MSNHSIPDLTIDIGSTTDGDPVIVLGQQLGTEESPQEVRLHPMQVRYLAEKLGIMPTGTAQVAVLSLDRTRLQRAFLRAGEMAGQLQRLLVIASNREHEDLTQAIDKAVTLVDFTSFICVEFEDDYEEIGPLSAKSPVPPPSPAADLPLFAQQ